MKKINEFQTTKTPNPGRLNTTIFGGMGSPKWEDKLDRFLSDERISREDLQRWMDKNFQVTDPLPKIRKSKQQTECSPEQLSGRGKAIRTYGRPKVVQRQLDVPSSSSLTPTPASGFNIQESRIPNVSATAKSCQTDTQTMDPLTDNEIQKSDAQTEQFLEQLRVLIGRALQTCSHPGAVHGPPSVFSFSSSTDNQYSGNPVVSAETFNSAKNPNNDPSSNPNLLEGTPAIDSDSESGISNVSAPVDSCRSEACGRLSLNSDSPDIFLPTPEKSSRLVRRKLKRLTPSTSKSMRPRNTPHNQGLLPTPRRNELKGKRYTQGDKEYLVRLLLNARSGEVMKAYREAAKFQKRTPRGIQSYFSQKLFKLNIKGLMALKLTKAEAKLFKNKYP